MKILFAKPCFDEETKEVLAAVLKQRYHTNAGNVAAFEQAFSDFTGGGQAIAVSSCQSALHLAMLDLNIGPGDEVIIPALTHVATCHAVTLTGATPVVVDVDETGNLDPDRVAEVVNRRTRAIIAVHYLGKICRMTELTSFMRPDTFQPEYIPVVEDCALALGSFSMNGGPPRHAGLLSYLGCFSFYPCKQITTGEGGMILTSHIEAAHRLKRRRCFGIDPNYGHVTQMGLNARMTEFQGALGLQQLKHAPRWIEKRHRNYEILNAALTGLEVVPTNESYGLSVFVGPERDKIRNKMSQQKVEASVYYPFTIYQHPYYKHLASDCPVAERFAAESLCLSVGQHLGPEHMVYQAQTLRNNL